MRAKYTISAILAFVVLPAIAQENSGKAVLDELHAAPKARSQADLDTKQLASAHREQPASAAERTNGLWQSWVAAICRGCGVREEQHSEKDAEALIARSRAQTKSVPEAIAQASMAPSGPRFIRPIDTLEGRSSGLTTGSIGQNSKATSPE